jgi:hypothetical protein
MALPDKPSVLQLLTRLRLRELVSLFDLNLAPASSKDAHVDLLVRSKKATLPSLLERLTRDELKEICSAHGLSDGGREKAVLIARLLGRSPPVFKNTSAYQHGLRRPYLAGDLVIFIGAGIARAGNLPSGTTLARSLLAYAAADHPTPETTIILDLATKLLDQGELSLALKELQRVLSPFTYEDTISRVLDDAQYEVPSIAQKIAALAPTLHSVVTTNFDCILERAFSGTWPVHTLASLDLSQTEHTILKLHGSPTEHDSLLLNRREYDRLLQRRPELRDYIRSLYRNKTLLFIGYNVQPPDLDWHLVEFRAYAADNPPQHFALMPHDQVNETRRHLLAKAGINVLEYDPANNHRELLDILELLATAQRRAHLLSRRWEAKADSSGPNPLASGCPPVWASEWGQDELGVFAGFSLGLVNYRMRWIRPGSVQMGSIPGARRTSFERSQHKVIITEGFWLGETAVTQELWEAVRGDNPSHFKEREQPVDQVGWEDCHQFCALLEKFVPGLGARLTRGVEWEYASRTGMTAARHFELALLARQSGQPFPVKQNQPNAWGLFDMEGKSWEWCMDGVAKGLREASGGAFLPGLHSVGLGFRLAVNH